MEAISYLVASVAIAVSVQAVLCVAALSSLVFAMLFSVAPAIAGWVAGQLTPGGSSPVMGNPR